MNRRETQSDLFANVEDQSDQLGSDLLIGSVAIAKFLLWRSKNGNGWNTRRVYHCAEKRSLPIHKQDGLGLVARKSALRAHFANLDDQFLSKLNAVASE